MFYLLDFSLDWEKVSSYGQDLLFKYGPNVLSALLILILGRILVGIVLSIVVKVMKKSDTDPSIQSFVSSLVYVGAMIFVAISALNALGIPTASFVAVVGAAGLAIGLAFQGALSNFAAGFLVIVFKPYKVGNFIQAGGESGTVKEIQLFTTILTTPDNKTIIVPNSQITGGNITNYSTQEKRRVDLVVGVGYNDDLDKVKKVLENVLKEEAAVLAEPKSIVAVLELGESSVNFAVRPWVKGSEYWPTYFRLQETIKKRFDKEGISIPFPQRDIHVYEHKKA